MSLAETTTSKPNGHAGRFGSIKLPTRETFESLARAPSVSLPVGKAKRAQLATDRVRASPAVTPTLSMMIGFTAIGLGMWGALFPRSVKRFLGVRSPEPVVRGLFGARELWTGYTLAGDPTRADVLWARVAGDIGDLAVLSSLNRPSNPSRAGARAGLAFVVAVTALDLVTAVRMSAVQRNCA